jgi:hypothetical protein
MTVQNSLQAITYHDALKEISNNAKLYGIAVTYARKYGISVCNAIQDMAKAFTLCHGNFVF